MNRKWKIAISLFLVLAICIPTASTAVQIFITKKPVVLPSNRLERMETGSRDLLAVQNPSRISVNQALHERQSSTIVIRTRDEDSGLYISRNEAVETALTLFPGICLLNPVGASLRRIDAPAYPLAKNLCWVVDMIGYNSEGEPCCNGCIIEGNVLPAYLPYGGHVIIDAVTGEVLYLDHLN